MTIQECNRRQSDADIITVSTNTQLRSSSCHQIITIVANRWLLCNRQVCVYSYRLTSSNGWNSSWSSPVTRGQSSYNLQFIYRLSTTPSPIMTEFNTAQKKTGITEVASVKCTTFPATRLNQHLRYFSWTLKTVQSQFNPNHKHTLRSAEYKRQLHHLPTATFRHLLHIALSFPQGENRLLFKSVIFWLCVSEIVWVGTAWFRRMSVTTCGLQNSQ
jgi:hypothetical protein